MIILGIMTPSDAFTFSSMINNMQYVMEKQYEAFENARKNIHISSEPKEITPENALHEALSSGITRSEVGESVTPKKGKSTYDRQ